MTELERARQELKHKLCCYKECTCERHAELDRFERLVRAAEHNAAVEACAKVATNAVGARRREIAAEIRALLVEETVGEERATRALLVDGTRVAVWRRR